MESPDIVCPASDRISIFTNSGEGKFVLASSLVVTQGLASYAWGGVIAAGDIDGDGRPDLASMDLHGTVSLFKNMKYGKFVLETNIDLGDRNPMGVGLYDANGDGAVDLAVDLNDFNETLIFTNNPPSFFNNSGTLHLGLYADWVWEGTGLQIIVIGSPPSTATADLNGDGHADFIEADYFGSLLSVSLSVPTLTISHETNTVVSWPAGWTSWTLQETSDWTNWTTSTGFVSDGTKIRHTVNPQTRTRAFRLAHP